MENNQSGCCGGSSHGTGGCGGSCGGGCSCSGAVPNSSENPLEVRISPLEETMLGKLSQCPFLPVAQFILKSTRPEEQPHMSLEPVFLETGAESLEQVKHFGQTLLELADKNIVSLDYSCPLEGSDYSIFQNSSAYALLMQTVEDGKQDPQFPYLPPEIVQGSLCLTALGELVIEQLDFT